MSSFSGFAAPESLLTAIGRVAVRSAGFEERLRDVVLDMADVSDESGAGWVIFEGQNATWLIDNGLAMLDRYAEDGWEEAVRFGPNIERLRELLKEAQRLKEDRNVIIHGVWRPFHRSGFDGKPVFGDVRSTNTLDSKDVFHVFRSRYRKTFDAQVWSTEDVEVVADRFEVLEQKLIATYEDACDWPPTGTLRAATHHIRLRPF